MEQTSAELTSPVCCRTLSDLQSELLPVLSTVLHTIVLNTTVTPGGIVYCGCVSTGLDTVLPKEAERKLHLVRKLVLWDKCNRRVSSVGQNRTHQPTIRTIRKSVNWVMYISANHWTLLSAVIPCPCVLPVSSISALTVPSSPTKLVTHTHKTCMRTHSPTHFQNNTRLFTKPENPERNHISKGVWSSHTDVAVFFFKFSFHVRDSPLLSLPPPCSAQCDTLSFPQPSSPSLHLIPHDHREKVLSGRDASFEKSCRGSLRRRVREDAQPERQMFR